MKSILFVLFALIAGFILGIAVSELIGAIGYLWFDEVVGIKYLPLYCALLSAGVTVIFFIWRHSKT